MGFNSAFKGLNTARLIASYNITTLFLHLTYSKPNQTKKKLGKKERQDNQAIQKCIATISRVTDVTSVSAQICDI